MSIYLIIIFVVIVNVIWMNYKTNNFKKSFTESFTQREPNSFFIKSSNRNKNLLVFLGLFIFIIGLGYKNSIDYEIIQYSTSAKYILNTIILIAVLLNFLQARNTYLTITNSSIAYKIYGFFGSFIGGGIFIALFVVLIFIPTLDKIIIKHPKKVIYENVKILEKETYEGKGKHYYINVMSKKLNQKIRFDLNKNQYKNFETKKIIKIKYYQTKKGTTYLKNYENPL